jgi:hypothetical protein
MGVMTARSAADGRLTIATILVADGTIAASSRLRNAVCQSRVGIDLILGKRVCLQIGEDLFQLILAEEMLKEEGLRCLKGVMQRV